MQKKNELLRFACYLNTFSEKKISSKKLKKKNYSITHNMP